MDGQIAAAMVRARDEDGRGVSPRDIIAECFATNSKTHDPPSYPFPKNCECRYHIIVTNVNKKADAINQNF